MGDGEQNGDKIRIHLCHLLFVRLYSVFKSGDAGGCVQMCMQVLGDEVGLSDDASMNC
jgi:hypothetical protein